MKTQPEKSKYKFVCMFRNMKIVSTFYQYLCELATHNKNIIINSLKLTFAERIGAKKTSSMLAKKSFHLYLFSMINKVSIEPKKSYML